MSYDTEDRLSAALNGIVGERPYTPDLQQIESRGRKLRRRRLAWRASAGGTFAVAAVAAVAVATSGGGIQAPAPDLAAQRPAPAGTAQDAPLVQLVGYLTTADAPTGDATLVLRDQVFSDGSKIDVWDLHADNGDYYFAKTRSAIPAQVKGKHLQQGGAERRKAVAAATYAAKGDLNEARKQMAFADLPANPKVKPTLEAPGATPSSPPLSAEAKKLKKIKGNYHPINTTDNWVWNNSLNALRDGAGSPMVRAGVLRLLGQMPEVKVKKGTLHGQPVLTLAAGPLATTVEDGSDEVLTVNADNGLPIRYAAEGFTINYTVTRVTIADVAKGKF
jgi:hypothetical protein